MPELAVTVVGQDRPGIIARTAELLAGLGMNLEDSSMTLLRGHFAMTLICAGEADVTTVEQALTPLVDGSLEVTVRPVPPAEQVGGGPVQSVLVSVHGADRLGIVAEMAGVLAEHGGNVIDLSTKLVGNLYVLTAEVDLAAPTGVDQLTAALTPVAAELGVDVSVEPIVDDEL
ncbi:glycine cleavage system protein R [Microlunatus sp. Y2014]|uniref:glycine cleavage system protein R n=1 Tax=Microlunatus sp. Y2014 TaxID=3418488 RepID=UPI003DA79F84